MVAVVFPADETTRRFLKSQGREADWKACEAGEEVRFDADRLVDLNTIEPLIAPVEDLAGARAVRHAMGVAVRRVLIGSGASLADLARLARMMAGRGVHDGTELVVIPGSRQTLDTAAQNGVLQAITAGGARVLGAGLPSDPASAAGLNVTGLCYAARAEERTGRRTAWYVASLESCAAAALAGRIVDPREVDAEFRRDEEPETYALDHSHILGPLAATEPGAGGADSGGLRPLPAPVPLEGPLRGAVLLKLGDHVTTQHILPWGATTEPLIADVGSLAARAFARVDGDFVRRARAHGGGFAMAGRDLGSGDRAELAAIVVTALKVRAVLARSFDPQFRELLVHAGVLPLRLRTEHDWQGITAGDELEIPGLPETLEVGKPLVVRNLTRGTQHTLAHDLDGHGIALVRAGGVLRLGVPEPTGREEARR
jgi:aconitate hydratase